jgi:prepilin-type N-terminal cleavage/methylation domain-containing protein
MSIRPSRPHRSRVPRQHRGFTLLESALGLVIAGLLLAAVLATDALLAQSRAREFAREAASLAGAIQLYRARYDALPGDDPGAPRRWPGVAGGNGNGILGGRYDQATPADASALASGAEDNESLLAWWHLRRAGFLTGATDGAAAASTARLGTSAGALGLQTGAFGMTGMVVCVGEAAGATAESIDRRLDDGSPHHGTVRAGASTAQPATAYAHGDRYVVCVSVEGRSGPSMLAAAAAAGTTEPAGSGTAPAQAGGNAAPAGGTDATGAQTTASAAPQTTTASGADAPTGSDSSSSGGGDGWRGLVDLFRRWSQRWSHG